LKICVLRQRKRQPELLLPQLLQPELPIPLGAIDQQGHRLARRQRLQPAQIRRLERVGDWNAYEIRCDGPRVEILLNGERTLVFTEDDPAVSADGLIALKIHGGCKAEISFRAIMIEER